MRNGPRFTRRDFLKSTAVLGTVAAAPPAWMAHCGFGDGGPLAFFDAHERATLGALCDRILPPDDAPGARELGAAVYIERLLTAFDGPVPWIYAGGPYSGRNPYPDPRDGTPSHRHPPNRFRHPTPLSRLQELFWRAQLFGADAAGLPAHLAAQMGGALRGLREIYREGLAIVDTTAESNAGAPFVELDTADQDELLPRLDWPGTFPVDPVRGGTFFDRVIQHTLEGCFSAPEYGGNRGGAGWRMVGIEGDSQPLGYSIFSEATGSYRERPDHPMSTPNPDELASDGTLAPKPLSADGLAIQKNIAALGGVLGQFVPGACA